MVTLHGTITRLKNQTMVFVRKVDARILYFNRHVECKSRLRGKLNIKKVTMMENAAKFRMSKYYLLLCI